MILFTEVILVATSTTRKLWYVKVVWPRVERTQMADALKDAEDILAGLVYHPKVNNMFRLFVG